MTTNTLYPIFLKLDKINTLIVGGGNIGLEKLNFILVDSIFYEKSEQVLP